MKILGSFQYKTPYEVFEELTGINVKNLPSYALIS